MKKFELSSEESILMEILYKETWDNYRLDIMAWIIVFFAVVVYALLSFFTLNVVGIFHKYTEMNITKAYWGVAVTGSGAVFITIWLYRAVITLLILKGNYSYVLTNKRVIRPSDFILHKKMPGYFLHMAYRVVYVEKTPKMGYLLIYQSDKEKPKKVPMGYLSKYGEEFLYNLKNLLGDKFELELRWNKEYKIITNEYKRKSQEEEKTLK